MTVSTATRTQTHAGSGSTGPFTADFRLLDKSHITVTKISSSGSRTTLTESGGDFTSSLVNLGLSGITLTTTTAVASGETLVIDGSTPISQEVDYANQGRFFPETHETSYDRLTLIAQEQSELVNRCLSVGSEVSIDGLLPTPVAFQSFRWNAGATALEAFTPLPNTTLVDSNYFADDGGSPSSPPSGTNGGVAIGDGVSATGSDSFVAGGTSNSCSASRGAIVGGSGNELPNAADNSFIGGGTSHTVTATSGFGGYGIIGGYQNQVAGICDRFLLAGGFEIVVSGNLYDSMITGRQHNIEAGENRLGCLVGGGRAKNPLSWSMTLGAGNFNGTAGQAQSVVAPVAVSTSGTTTDRLRLGGAAGSANHIEMPNNSAWMVSMDLIARKDDGATVETYKGNFSIKRGANEAATAMVDALNAIDSNLSSYSVSVSADTTNGGPKIDVTGASGHDVDWAGTLTITQVTA